MYIPLSRICMLCVEEHIIVTHTRSSKLQVQALTTWHIFARCYVMVIWGAL